ncbi:MAG TPA: glycerophosphodiester phosphodiesterase family protein [Gemmataceae bacterium]|nr:glycerophosphodiester phosphodiesterase family protein [Gemmataceae bacterium]
MPPLFDLQGHRGARGLRPENTLPAFETALDLGVTTIETDVHLTRDGVPVLCHDDRISERLCRLIPGGAAPDPASRPAIRTLTLAQMRAYRADRNPEPEHLPEQDPGVTPLARLFAAARGIDPYAPPALADLFAFAAAYQGEPGAQAGKTAAQREQARRVRFNLELKRIPYRPEAIGDTFDGERPGLLEERVVEAIRSAGMVERTGVCSFDHRCLRALRRLEPRLRTAVLIYNTAPVAPAELVRQADAHAYGPDFEFLDERQVRQLHAAGVPVVPWTVNEVRDMERLLDWGVDGIATDYPDRLAALLRRRGIEF